MPKGIPDEAKDLFQRRFGKHVRFDEPLLPYVAYRVGGPADILVFPQTEDDLSWISETAKRFAVPVTVIGTGTNLLVRDGGIRGVTVSLLHAFQEIEPIAGKPNWVKVGGGVEKPRFLEWSIQNHLTGLEFSSGIPGTIGGGIYMNAGTKYGSYGDILRELRLFDWKRGLVQLNRSEVHFGYREQNAVTGAIVTYVVFELKQGKGGDVRTEMERIIAERAEKQPLDFPSCGSTFKNPEGHSAGRLIERAGLKGTVVGGAEISLKHANFILNKQNAKARDILELIAIIKKTVKEKSQVDLECEVIILGDD